MIPYDYEYRRLRLLPAFIKGLKNCAYFIGASALGAVAEIKNHIHAFPDPFGIAGKFSESYT